MSWFEDKVVPYLSTEANVAVLKAEYDTEVSKLAMEKVPGVLQNKEEILNEKKELQKQFNEFKEKYSSFESGEVTFEMFTQLKNEYEALKVSGGGELTETERTEIYNNGKKAVEDLFNPKFSKLETENATLQTSLEKANGKYLDFRARNEILKAIDEANIDSDDYWLEGLIGKSQISYNPEEDKLNIMIPHDGGTLPLSDWKSIYPQTDVGKKRVKAPLNYGGGANGGRGSQGGPMSLEEIEKMPDRGDRIKAMEDNGYIPK